VALPAQPRESPAGIRSHEPALSYCEPEHRRWSDDDARKRAIIDSTRWPAKPESMADCDRDRPSSCRSA